MFKKKLDKIKRVLEFDMDSPLKLVSHDSPYFHFAEDNGEILRCRLLFSRPLREKEKLGKHNLYPMLICDIETMEDCGYNHVHLLTIKSIEKHNNKNNVFYMDVEIPNPASGIFQLGISTRLS